MPYPSYCWSTLAIWRCAVCASRSKQEASLELGAVVRNSTTKSVHPPPSPTLQEPTKPRPTCARKSTSCASRSATSPLAHIFQRACCWSAPQGLAKPCSLVPSQARQVYLSIVQVAPTSSNSSSGSEPVACAISLSRPKRTLLVSSLSMKSTRLGERAVEHRLMPA